jgi:radical SAM superfamily enzyme
VRLSLDKYIEAYVGANCLNKSRAVEICKRLKEINDASWDVIDKKKSWPLWKRFVEFFNFKAFAAEAKDLKKRSDELILLLNEIIELHIGTRH